jgi:oxygen-independent coproporphyrinogen-3 oxidase
LHRDDATTSPATIAEAGGSSHAPAFGVYIHWPFCLSKCPYCDFNSHVRHAAIDEARFVRAFLAEVASNAERAPGRTVTSIFFGGGTPSLMQPTTVAAILDGIGRAWTVAPDVEVTLEANPTSVEATRFRGYRAAGVNRVSLGVQALDDEALKRLGRTHTAQEALAAVAIARQVFERYSFDLIYAREHQSPDAWAAELKRAIAEAAEHLSLYQLTIELDTPFAALRTAGKLTIPDEDCARRLYDLTLDIEGRRHATATEKRPETWLERVEALGHGLVTDDILIREEMADEFLLMGLRLTEGIDPRGYAQISGRSLDPRRLAILDQEGAVEITPEGRLRVTPAGFPVLDAVVADLAA